MINGPTVIYPLTYSLYSTLYYRMRCTDAQNCVIISITDKPLLKEKDSPVELVYPANKSSPQNFGCCRLDRFRQHHATGKGEKRRIKC